VVSARGPFSVGDDRLRTLRWFVHRGPDGYPMARSIARSYRFGESFDTYPAAARRLAPFASVDCSTRARRLPDSSLILLRCIVRRLPGGCLTARSYHFGVSFDEYTAAARRLAPTASGNRSTRTRRLSDGSLPSLRRIARCVPDGCPTVRSYSLRRIVRCIPGGCPVACLTARLPVRFRVVPGVLPGFLPGVVPGSSLRQSGSVTTPQLA
jgi:hypothetical protein